MQKLILYWVLCPKKDVYSVWWGWYLSKSWHAETKVGVGALLESRSESVVSSECVCLSDSHSVLRFSSMRTHTLVSSYTAPPIPLLLSPVTCYVFAPTARSPWQPCLPLPRQQFKHSTPKQKERKFSLPDKQAFLPLSKEEKSTTVLLLEDESMIFKVFCSCELWKVWFINLQLIQAALKA